MSIEFPGKPAQLTIARDNGMGNGKTRRSSDAGSDAAGTTKAGGDQLSLTADAARYARLSAAVNAAPVVDIQRVDSVKRVIAQGTYTPDPQRLADRLAGFEGLLTLSLAA